MSILKASVDKHGGVHGGVVAAQEFAKASSAKCGFTSPILQPTAETHHIHHIIVPYLQVLFTYKVTVPTTGPAYLIKRFLPFLRICVNANRFETVFVYTFNLLQTQGKKFQFLTTLLSCKRRLSVQ